jgi:hypothetical protein
MKNKNLNNIDSVNYYDLEKLLNNFIFFMENEVKEEICDNGDVLETKKILVSLFLKSCIKYLIAPIFFMSKNYFHIF